MKIKFLVKWLVGGEPYFSLTNRIFHGVCVIVVLALAYNIPLNYFVGLPFIAIMSAVALVLFFGIYYLSRFKGKTDTARLIFCILGLSLFVINCFLNSGINGPTDMFFMLTMLMMVAIVPVRQYPLWIILNVIAVAGLHYLQYTHPAWFPYTYTNNKARFIDLTSAYLTVVSVAMVCYYIIRRNYEIEKNSAQERALELKRTNEEKNKLFSIIAHDLRSPLSNIQTYLELLTEVKLSDEERLTLQKDLLNSTRGTLSMLNNVLEWSQDQMKGIKPVMGPLQLDKVLSSQIGLFTTIAASKGIYIEAALDPKLEVTGNSNMLELIVRNLINNAIKFTALGGTINVSANNRNGKCLIRVKDSGTGKPVKLSDDVFRLNGQSTTGTANEKGVGLGLVLCKEYTEAHNGRIWFECGTESGVSFFVEIPSAPAPSRVAAV